MQAETQSHTEEYDIVIYGGTSAAVTAAIEAKASGRSVIIISPDKQIGGMTTAGLGWADAGRRDLVGGLAREFHHRVWKYYQNSKNWKWQTPAEYGTGRAQGGSSALDDTTQTAWVFEPSAAESVLNQWLSEKGVPLITQAKLDRENGVCKHGNRIISIRTLDGSVFHAKVFIDATYEGDLMAAAGVQYRTGRESSDTFGESYNGIQSGRTTNQMPWGVSPYVQAGNSGSGLLRWPPMNAEPGGRNGDPDSRIQAYCFRMCLTDVKNNLIPIPKPYGYREQDFELLFRAIEAGQTQRFYKLSPLPNRKTDSNNDSGVSTNLIGCNYDYPEADYDRREQIVAEHRYWQQGMAWTLRNHPRVPPELRQEHSRWGLPADEFLQTGHWPHQIYVREARRMAADFTVTQNHLMRLEQTMRPIGIGSYAMDSHNVQRHVHIDDHGKAHARTEGDVQIRPGGPYPIDYGAITPRNAQCANLLVPVAVSASHIAFGSIRMEPVFMILGQSAATAASLAIEHRLDVQNIPYETLRTALEQRGQIIELPESVAAAH